MTITTPKRRYFIETFGCQMNVNDSEKVAGLLQAAGHQPAPNAQLADFVFINTCAVREKAAEKLYSALGRFGARRRSEPGLVVAVGGCVAQLQGTEVTRRAPYVDIVVGTHNFGRVPELLDEVTRTRVREVDLDRKASTFAIPHEVVAHGNPVRAYVTVMEGCNHVCSFCVVPRTRGPEKCRPSDNVVAEVRSLVARGVHEVMLLGQTVNAYAHGADDFPRLLRRVAEVEGLLRLRFTTSHPEHVDEGVARVFAEVPVVCPYLHLPVQSGSDRVLAHMRRGYTWAEYEEKAGMLRAHVPDLALTTDIIVGYPGETEREFQETMDLVERIAFDGVFVFAYSPRPGTTAHRVPDDVPHREKIRRLQVLNAMQQHRQRQRNAAAIGSRQEVLVESVNGKGQVWGRTPHFRIVHFDGAGLQVNTFVEVEITGATPNALQGRAVGAGPWPAATAVDAHRATTL